MAPRKEREKLTKANEDNAETMILEYLRRVNRPYSATDVSSNLHNAVSKNSAQKMLIVLSERGDLVTKQWGKQSIYYIRQSNMQTVSAEQLACMDGQADHLKQELLSLKNAYKEKTQVLENVKGTSRTREIQHILASTDAEIERFEILLKPIRDGTRKVVSYDERCIVEARVASTSKEARSRYKMFKTLWDEVCEKVDDTKNLEDTLGIEWV